MNLWRKRWIVGLALMGLFALGTKCPKPPKTVIVPDLMDNTVDAARQIVAESKLLLSVEGEVFSSTIAKGRICKQSPMRGSKVKRWITVKVWVSKGPEIVKHAVPNLIGSELSEAKKILQNINLKVGKIDTAHSKKIAKGYIISTDPVAGVEVPSGTSVDITISAGPKIKYVKVPRVIGMKIWTAKRVIRRAGLRVGRVSRRVTTEYYEYTVFGQFPRPGKSVPVGSKVNLTVAAALP